MKTLGDCGSIPKIGMRLPRLRNALQTHDVSQLQIVYCVFDGSALVSLNAIPSEAKTTPIFLPRSLITSLNHLFRRWMADTHPNWRTGPDCAGILTWDVIADGWSHKHFGYRQQFCRQERVVTASHPIQTV